MMILGYIGYGLVGATNKIIGQVKLHAFNYLLVLELIVKITLIG
jgi:hypothetical protein